MNPPWYPACPAAARSDFSSGVSGQIHPLELDQRPPDRRGQMQDHHPRPSQRQQPSDHYKGHEQGVHADHEVGQDAIGHRGEW